MRLSVLPGVSAPGLAGQEDSLHSYKRDGFSVLIARGRTTLFEGKPARRTTAFARTVAARVRAALLVTRATGLGGADVGDFLPAGDHLNLAGAPLSSIWEDCRGFQIAEGTDQIIVYIAGPLLRASYADKAKGDSSL